MKRQAKARSTIKGSTRLQIVNFAKHARIMDISIDPAGCVQRTRRASTMKVRRLNHTGRVTRSKNYGLCTPI
jgi:hypothetical protein